MVRWEVFVVGSNTHEIRITLGQWYDDDLAVVVRLDTGSLAYPSRPPAVHVREGQTWLPYGDFLGRARVKGSCFHVDIWKHFRKTFSKGVWKAYSMSYVYSALVKEVRMEMQRKRRVSDQQICRRLLPLPADVLGEICSFV